ncbi:hypothetical protein ES705_15610 [subsurface metagenome]
MVNKEFPIPTKICLEAKQFMKHLLKQLKDNGINVTGLDHGCLYLIAWTFHRLVRATQKIEDEGEIIKEVTARGNRITKTHPAIKIEYDSRAQLTRLLVEFGLTLKSSGRLEDAKQGNLFEECPPGLQKFRIVKK